MQENGKRFSPEHIAVISTFRHVLGCERDAKFRDAMARFPLHVAVAAGSADHVRTLLAAGRDPLDAPNGASPMSLACALPRDIGMPIMMLLLAAMAGTPAFRAAQQPLRWILAQDQAKTDAAIRDAGAELEKERRRLRKNGKERAAHDIAEAMAVTAIQLAVAVGNGPAVEPAKSSAPTRAEAASPASEDHRKYCRKTFDVIFDNILRTHLMEQGIGLLLNADLALRPAPRGPVNIRRSP